MIYFELDYEAEKPQYFVDCSSKFVIASSPIAVAPRYIVLSRNGECVGHLDATFDFSNLPPEFHAWVVNILISNRALIHLGA